MNWDSAIIFCTFLALIVLTCQAQQAEIYHPMQERIQKWEAEEKNYPVLSYPWGKEPISVFNR